MRIGRDAENHKGVVGATEPVRAAATGDAVVSASLHQGITN